MSHYRVDLEDIYFNLFKVLKVQEQTDELEENDLKGIIEELSKFIGQEVWACRESGDVEGVHLVDGSVKAPPSFHGPKNAYYENGWFGLGYKEELGGTPVPQAVALACSGICIGANVAFSMYPGLSQGAMNVILQVGSQEQKDRYVPLMMDGTWGGTMCLTEANAGSDVGAGTTTAVLGDDGFYRVKGTKIFISSGESDLYENNIHMVLARTPGSPEGTKGLSLFIVPQKRGDNMPGASELNDVVCSKVEEKMGIHGSSTCVLNFGQTKESLGELIGKEGEGIQNMFILMNEARLLCGMQGEAQANFAYEMALNYAKERPQFGTEIINLPDVRRMLLGMRSMARGLRSLNYYIGDLLEKESKGDHDAAAEVAFLTPISKSLGSEQGFNIASEAVQVYGGYGYCSEYGVEQFVRDAKIATIYEGTNGIQAMDFVMRKTLKDQAKTFQAIGAKVQKAMEEAQKHSDLAACLGPMAKSMAKSVEIIEFYGKLAKEGKTNVILETAHPFMNFAGHLVIAWRLLESTLIAKNSLGQASTEDEKSFLRSKEEDFKFFVQHTLTKNSGLAQSILNFESFSGYYL